jgi:hypothetical protein
MESFMEFMTGGNCSTNPNTVRKAKIQAFMEPTKMITRIERKERLFLHQLHLTSTLSCNRLTNYAAKFTLSKTQLYCVHGGESLLVLLESVLCDGTARLTVYVDRVDAGLQNLHFERNYPGVIALFPMPSTG